jgi:predicted Zn-dependent protease
MTGPEPIACCASRREQLVDLAAGRIGEDASDELLRHVEGCPRCSSGLAIVADVASVALASEKSGRRLPWLATIAAAAAAAAILFAVFALTREDPVSSLADLRPPWLVASTPRGEGTAVPADALLAFGEGRYAEAARDLDAALTRSPNDPVVSHYAGVAHLLAGDAVAAEKRLTAAAEASEGLLREASLWYLAQAFLVRGDARSARDALERLRALDGDYAPNAESLLEKLGAAGH